MFQLIYTSAPRLLEAGKTGFGTVARSREIPSPLVSYLERLSTFDRSAGISELQFYSVFRMGAIRYRAFSRVADCGADYTRRTNHIAHHIVVPLDSEEDQALRTSTPAGAMLALQGLFRDSWQEAPRWLPPVPLPGMLPVEAYGCWQALTGQAGCERWLGSARYSGACCLLFQEPLESGRLLEFLHDGQRTMPDNGWERGFSTASVGNLSSTVFPLVCLEGKQRQAGALPKAGLPCLEIGSGLAAPVEMDLPSQPPACAPLPENDPPAFSAPDPAFAEPEPQPAPLNYFPADGEPPRRFKPAEAHEPANRNSLYIAAAIAAVFLILAYSRTASEDESPKTPQIDPPSASPAEKTQDGSAKQPTTEAGSGNAEHTTSSDPDAATKTHSTTPTPHASKANEENSQKSNGNDPETSDARQENGAEGSQATAPKQGGASSVENPQDGSAKQPTTEAVNGKAKTAGNDTGHTPPPDPGDAIIIAPQTSVPPAPTISKKENPIEAPKGEPRQDAQPAPPPTAWESPANRVEIERKEGGFFIKIHFQFSAQELKNHLGLPDANFYLENGNELKGTETRSKKTNVPFSEVLAGKRDAALKARQERDQSEKSFNPKKQKRLSEMKARMKAKEKLSQEENAEYKRLLGEEKKRLATEEKASQSDSDYQAALEREKSKLEEQYKQQSRIKITLGAHRGGGVYPLSISYENMP